MMPTEACLIFTAVNTRRAARLMTLGGDVEAGAIRAFTFSEFVEALIQVACRRSPPPADGAILSTEWVVGALVSLVEGVVLVRVAREDVRGFRQ